MISILGRVKNFFVRYAIAIMSVIALVGAIGTVAFCWLYIGARDDLSAQVSKCNEQKAISVAEAERAATESLQAAHSRKIESYEKRIEALERARAISDEGRRLAEEGTAEKEAIIRQLELQGETDEIPDSFEALNVFVPNCAIPDGLFVSTGTDRENEDRSSAGGRKGCRNTGLPNSTDSFAEIFSPITYSDSLIILGRYVDALESCNADKAAIRSFGE